MANAEKSGFHRAAEPAVLILRGDDAGEFLNGQVSNDVATLADGESRYALLLTPKGKLRAELTIARDGDETLVICAAAHKALVEQTIDKFRIGYFFSVEDASGDWALIRVVGAEAAAAAEALSSPYVPLESPLGLDLLVEGGVAEQAEAELLERGFEALSEADFATARVLAGVPAFGAELDEDTFPAEAALEARAVSFEKGCYVGQETVARMHYKGKPNRHLRILRSEQPLVPGTAVTAADGRALGTVGTAVADAGGSPAALAILRREGAPGDTVDAGGVTATIVEIPAAATV